MALVTAVCVVNELRADEGIFGITAIDKRSVHAEVWVGPYGLRGDVQADRKHHGGFDKALYFYADDDAEYWAAELGRELHPGWFGENLRVSGIDVNAARTGERWRIGSGEDALEVELTMPRNPCQTFARWVGGDDERGWVKRFADARRFGAYARVTKPGTVTAGVPVTVLFSDAAAPTIAELWGRA
jgi:MOSC domain-containing protein YiiM